MDNLSKADRSAQMSRVRTQHTAPEMLIRHLVHRLGYRYKLHDSSLPSRPDLVFPKRKKIILVNGCFWHGHSCPRGTLPSSNYNFWHTKIKTNKERDFNQLIALERLGWSVFIVWECETKAARVIDLQFRLIAFLES
jgi:DNA mismatch endonuclease (patch repair protein)